MRTRKVAAALAPALACTLMLNGTQVVAQGTAAAAPATPNPATPNPAVPMPVTPPVGSLAKPLVPPPATPRAPGAPATLPGPHGGPLVTAPTPATPGAVVGPAAAAAPPPAVTGTGTTPLTLDQVIALAVNNNSSVLLARERLKNAGYQIDATNAEARPQVTASIVDSYSSQKSYGTAGAASVTNPALPGGGTIPTITDEGGGTTTTFVGGGGGGTAASSGGSSTTSTAVTTPSTSRGTTLSTGTSGGGTTGPGGGTGTGSTGTAGTTGTVGTGTAGTGTTGAATGQVRGASLEALPPVIQHYQEAMLGPVPGTARATAASSSAATPHASNPTGGSNSPTSTTTGTNLGSSSSGYHDNYEGRATVTQYIDLFGFVPAALDVEKYTREFYQIDLRRIQNEAALAAKDDFFSVLRDQSQIAVDQEQINAAAADLRITEVQETAGTATRAAVLTAAVTVANDQQTQVNDQNTLNLAIANLNNLLGLPPSNQIALQTPALPPFDAAVDLNKSTQEALDQRPELQQAHNNVIIAQKLIKLAGASAYPTLGLSGEASYNGNAVAGSPHDDYVVTAQLDIPIYDGGYARAEVNSAKVDLATQETTQSQLEQNVRLEVRQAYLDILSDQQNARTAQINTRNATEAARIAQLQYQYGTNTFLNVLNAEAQLATAQTDELNAEFSYQTDLATLVRAIGGR